MKLFLSYAAENISVAEEIYYALIGEGYDVFFDQSSLLAGDNYTKRLHDAIAHSDGMVFLISPKSVESGSYARTEMKYASKKWSHPEHRVLPVMIEPTDFNIIPTYLKTVTILQPAGNIAAETVEALQTWQTLAPAVSGTPQPSSSLVGLLTLLVSGLLAATVLGAGFSWYYPSVKADLNLVFLFTLVGILLAVATRGIWRVITRAIK